MQIKDVSDLAKKVSGTTAGRMALYAAILTFLTTLTEGGFRIAELMLKKDQPEKIVVVKGGPEANAPFMKATPNSPGIMVPNEGTHVHEDSVFISKRLIFIILGLLVFLAGMELRRHLNKRDGS